MLPQTDVWLRGQTDPRTLKSGLLHSRMAEAIAWCDALQTMSNLRSESLRPRLLHDGADDLVCGVGNSRQQQLRFRRMPVAQQKPLFATGKFLLYFPDEDLCDGAAEAASDGFFDVFNLPAYDTWVSFFVEEGRTQRSSRRYLLSYVPPSMLAAADAGIEVNPEECIVWLDRSDVAIRSVVDAVFK